MFNEEHLDIRTVTMGIDLRSCSAPDADVLCRLVFERITSAAGELVIAADELGERFGVPIVNKRIAVSPIASIAAAHDPPVMMRLAQTLDEAAAAVGVDFIGGFSAIIDRRTTNGGRALIDAMPQALSSTQRVCGSLNLASTRSGINMDAVILAGRTIVDLAAASADRDGMAAAKLVVFANMPADNPFMAGAVHGEGQGESVLNIGVSGPGVVKRALERLVNGHDTKLSLADLAEEIKTTAFRITRVGELIGRDLADRLGVNFGIVDLSLAPTPQIGDSIGEILQVMGVEKIGAPGSTAALAMLNDAVKKGGAFASSSVGGLSGAFIPVMEDAALARAAAEGTLTLAKLEAMTSVCSVGLDMIALPGDTSAETLAAIIADEMAIGMVNHKTTACRLIPAVGKGVGDTVSLGGLFGQSATIPVIGCEGSNRFVRFGGRIPAPLQSLRN
jgi:hypothetical protein